MSVDMANPPAAPDNGATQGLRETKNHEAREAEGAVRSLRPDSYSSSDNESGMDSGGSWGLYPGNALFTVILVEEPRKIKLLDNLFGPPEGES
jgi:hypothetical protein